MNTMEIGERLKLLRGTLSQDEFSQRVGFNKNSIGNYERGERTPDVVFLKTVCEKFGASSNWLLFGTGPVYDPSRTTIEPARAGIMCAGDPLSKVVVHELPINEEHVAGCETGQIIMVPMVEARLSAGTGSFETGGAAERYYAFRLDFLRRKGVPSRMVLMRVSGDSMEPEIRHDDVVLIDQSQTTPTPGRLYAVSVEDMVYIKEVNAEPGKLVLSSYNKAYPALEVDVRGDLKDGIRIIGHAVWVGRELK